MLKLLTNLMPIPAPLTRCASLQPSPRGKVVALAAQWAPRFSPTGHRYVASWWSSSACLAARATSIVGNILRGPLGRAEPIGGTLRAHFFFVQCITWSERLDALHIVAFEALSRGLSEKGGCFICLFVCLSLYHSITLHTQTSRFQAGCGEARRG